MLPGIYHTKIGYVNSGHLLQYIHSQLQPINDVELLLLKGHLMIEYLFNQGIIRFSRTDESGTKTLLKFGFMEKLALMEFMGMFFRTDGETLKAQITKVNTIRNKLSHNLEYEKSLIPSLIGDYNDVFEIMGKKGIKVPATVIGKLDLMLSGICGHVVGKLDSMITINNQYAEATKDEFQEKVQQEVLRYTKETDEDVRGAVR